MNYKDLQNISYLSQQILTESSSEEHDVMNRWPYSSPYLQEARDGYGDDSKFKQDTDAASFRPGKDVPKVKKFGRISKAVPHGIGAHANRTASRVSTIVGDDPGAPRSQKMPTKSKMVKKNGKWQKVKEQLELWVNSLLDEGYDLSNYTWDDMYDFYLNEAKSFDLYDLVLAHLLDEGYADTYEAAEAIMVNMSEEWRESIMEVSMMHVQLAAQPRPAEVRKAPAKKPSPVDYAPAAGTAAAGGAALAGMARGGRKRKKPDVMPSFR